jgi:TonB family protein
MSRLRVRRVPHFEPIHKFMPDYPTGANSRSVSGTIRLKMFVNKTGHVGAACPVYPDGERRPDASLVSAAQKAAMQWEFPPSFGLGCNLQLKFDYVEVLIAFKFAPPQTSPS